MSERAADVIDFYDRHPISETQVREALHRAGKDLRQLGVPNSRRIAAASLVRSAEYEEIPT